MMADGLHCLLQHPGQQQLLAQDPGLAAPAVEEMLRFATPVLHSLPRVALEDVPLPSGTIPRGDLVLALIASAARDPEFIERPDEFDITRTDNPHIAFGVGEHYCLGANLARAELEEALAFLAPRMPGLALDGPPQLGGVEGVYGVDKLPITWSDSSTMSPNHGPASDVS
jgi:cytochrome P450